MTGDKAGTADPWWWPFAAAFNVGKIVVTGRPLQPQCIAECEPPPICDFRKMTAHEIEMADREAG